MNATTALSFPYLPAPAEVVSKTALLKPLASAACSVMLHVLLIGIAIFVTLGGSNGGGIPGDGIGSGSGSANRLFIAGILTLSSGSGAEIDTMPPSNEEGAAVAEPPHVAEVAQAQRLKEAFPQPEIDAVPIPSRIKPKQETPQKNAKARQSEKPSHQFQETVKSTPAKKGRERQPAAEEASGAIAGSSVREGAGDGRTPGGGSGVHPGSGGNVEGIGNQGTGFSGKVDSKPKVLNRSKVKYPEAARKNKVTGHVLLRFHLDEKGSISRLQVVKAEPPGVFENAALASVKHWRFAPAMKDGRPVPYWVELPMPFILK